MYWLQEQGLLVEYYRRFRDGHAGDPTGVRTLEKLLGGRPIARIEADWMSFVQRLGA